MTIFPLAPDQTIAQIYGQMEFEGINRKHMRLKSLKVTLDLLLPLTRYWPAKLENDLSFPPLPCLTPLRRSGGDPLEFQAETYPAKTRRMDSENFIILSSTVFDW